MTFGRRELTGALLGWAAVTCAVFLGAHGHYRIDARPEPDRSTRSWALGALENARLGNPRPAPGQSALDYDAPGPVIVMAWERGIVVGRHTGEGLVPTVDEAAARFAADERLTALPGWSARDDSRLRFTVTVVLGEGPVLLGVPALSELQVVPLREGLGVELDGERVFLTPDELLADGVTDHGIVTFVPDLSFGVPIDALVDRLGRQLGASGGDVLDRGRVFRFRAATLAEARYPKEEPVTEASLRRAAVEGADFLLRHMQRDGTYTYLYDARSGRPEEGGYNLPRHAGTTYFLAQVAQLEQHARARRGAQKALSWVRRTRIRHCGGQDLWCVDAGGEADVGSAALTVVAATELLASGDDPLARELVVHLTAFLRSMQREDGELMHVYDLDGDEPVDVQLMYYSGEAAFALLKAHEALGDEANLEAARRLMTHLTGSGWDFLGSHYYYGEEHWTCIAAGEARDRVEGDEGLEFCNRWFEWNDGLQYREGETPWSALGAYGFGPVVVPRLTPVGSRTEAFIQTYRLAQHRGAPTRHLRAHIERGLSQLLRYRWAPGPTHLFARPGAALGGMPGSPAELTVRNDFVQHAGSAFIEWADVLRSEREAVEAAAGPGPATEAPSAP